MLWIQFQGWSPAFGSRLLFYVFHQPSLQLALRRQLRRTVDLGRGGQVLMPEQGLHFFEREPRFLPPHADRVTKTVPPDLGKAGSERYRLNIILHQLARPERPLALGVRGSEHPVVARVVRCEGAPLNQEINDIFWQCEVGS